MRKKINWNFIESSTRMCVERTFGNLKGNSQFVTLARSNSEEQNERVVNTMEVKLDWLK